MSTEEENNAEVRREDQDRLNEFSRLNSKKLDMKEELNELVKKIDDLTDAEEAVMLADDSEEGTVKVMVGESFIDYNSSDATDFINAELDKYKQEKQALESQLETIETRQAELKKILYARFGKSINLEA